MVQTMKEWNYKGYRIFHMHDAGAYWFEVNDVNGEFVANCDTYEEAKKEIDKYKN